MTQPYELGKFGQYITVNVASNTATVNAVVKVPLGIQFSDNTTMTTAGGQVTVFSYTGDGSTTGYSTGNYSATSTAATDVFVGGVYQRKSTYSWSGTTLTFTAAPPSGAVIEIMVKYLGFSIGVPNDGSVTPAKIASTGTANSSTFLRGDLAWSSLGILPTTNVSSFSTNTNLTSTSPFMNVLTPTVGDLVQFLPNAQSIAVNQPITFTNLSNTYGFRVKNYGGKTLTIVAPSDTVTMYPYDVSTANGQWVYVSSRPNANVYFHPRARGAASLFATNYQGVALSETSLVYTTSTGYVYSTIKDGAISTAIGSSLYNGAMGGSIGNAGQFIRKIGPSQLVSFYGNTYFSTQGFRLVTVNATSITNTTETNFGSYYFGGCDATGLTDGSAGYLTVCAQSSTPNVVFFTPNSTAFNTTATVTLSATYNSQSQNPYLGAVNATACIYTSVISGTIQGVLVQSSGTVSTNTAITSGSYVGLVTFANNNFAAVAYSGTSVSIRQFSANATNVVLGGSVTIPNVYSTPQIYAVDANTFLVSAVGEYTLVATTGTTTSDAANYYNVNIYKVSLTNGNVVSSALVANTFAFGQGAPVQNFAWPNRGGTIGFLDNSTTSFGSFYQTIEIAP